VPPSYDTTSVPGLRVLTGGNQVRDIDAGFLALATDVGARLPYNAEAGGAPAQSIASTSPVAITGASASLTLPAFCLLSIYVVAFLTPSATGDARVFLELTGPSGPVVTDLQVIRALANSGAQTRAGGGIGSADGVVSVGGETGLPRNYNPPPGAYTMALKAASAAGTATITSFVALAIVQGLT
jgi:hypothetical protein